jgi:hypothetical protein
MERNKINWEKYLFSLNKVLKNIIIKNRKIKMGRNKIN